MWTPVDTTNQTAMQNFCAGLKTGNPDLNVADTDELITDAISRKQGTLFQFDNGTYQAYIFFKYNQTEDSWNVLFCSVTGTFTLAEAASTILAKVRDFIDSNQSERFYILVSKKYSAPILAFFGWFADAENVWELQPDKTKERTNSCCYHYYRDPELTHLD